VDVRTGHGRIVDPWTVEIGGERLTARSIVIAAGAEPLVPPIPGLEQSGYLTSDTMWDALGHREAPPRLLVIIGGGPIGAEMAQAFRRLGSEVTIVDGGEHILAKEDEEVSDFIAAQLRGEGVEILTGHHALRCEGKALVVGGEGGRKIAALRRAAGGGRQEAAPVRLRPRRARHRHLRASSSATNICSCATRTSTRRRRRHPYQLTHAAAHEAGSPR
jgi:pyruvate/2-oxoglutarate dehydrogenase complex dihydrolipoamide dehydrogenase (E3) component